MTRQLPRTPHKPGSPPWGLIAFGIGVFFAVWGTLQLAHWNRTGSWITKRPDMLVIETVIATIKGKYQWGMEHFLGGMFAFALLFLATFTAMQLLKKRPARSRALAAARHLGNADSMKLKAVEKRSDASRLTTGEVKGMMLLNAKDGDPRYVDWRSTGVIVMGTGAGKTTAESIPMCMDAPGVVFATTNKRDLPDAIRGAKEGVVWVFDAQQITGKQFPAWRLNLLDYVIDEVRAHKLAKIWVDASTPAGAKKDSYFDTAGPNLLAGHLLACALENLPISQIYKWLTHMKDRSSISILKRHNYLLPAMALEGVYDAPEEQRGGVFGTASEMVSFLNNSRVREWLEQQGPDDLREVFSPEKFVRSGNETMLALSKEGIGTTGPLTASLTMWVLDAAEEMADEYAHGRLPVPLVVVLDEAANVCRIQELPNLYSHYGSRGIFLVTILQSWAQGVRVWSEDGMKALWTAATFCMVGAGQKDTTFLKTVSESLGERYVTEYSISHGKGHGSRSTQQHLRPIMTIDDLVAMKPFEAVVIASGEDPFIGKTVPWMKRKKMEPLVKASIAEHEPKGHPAPVAVTV